jgi:hypothetical protein
MRIQSTYLAGEPLIIEEDDDPQLVAGDPFAELEWVDCPINSHDHLWLTEAGITRCVFCRRICWQ